MPVYVEKKNKRLFIKFDFRGKTYKQRLPESVNKTTANELEIKWRHRLLFESNGIETKVNISFEDFLKDYFMPFAEANHSKESFDYDTRICKEALKLWKGRPIKSIKASDIDRFKQIRTNTPTQHGRKRMPASVTRELSIISKIFSLAHDDEIIEVNPMNKVQMPKFDNTQNTVLPWADEEKFLAAFESEWARDIAILILNTGLRQNDALSLSKFSVDRDRREIRLLQGKTQRLVTISMNQVVEEIIKKYWTNSNGLLFPSPKTGLQGKSIKKAIAGAVKRSGISNVTVKDLRRTFGTRLNENNVDTATIARLLGHGDLRSVHRYARGQENMRQAVENLTDRASFVPRDASNEKSKAAND